MKNAMTVQYQSYSRVVKPRQPVQFDIYHNGHAVEAVVVGSKVTLAFTPHYAISRTK